MPDIIDCVKMPEAQSKDFYHPHAMVLTYMKPKKKKVEKSFSQSATEIEGGVVLEGQGAAAADEAEEPEMEEIRTVFCAPESIVSTWMGVWEGVEGEGGEEQDKRA